MMVPPGRSQPRRSASAIMAMPTRSLTLPPGLLDATLTATAVGTPAAMRRSRTSGVWPTAWRIVSCMRVPPRGPRGSVVLLRRSRLSVRPEPADAKPQAANPWLCHCSPNRLRRARRVGRRGKMRTGAGVALHAGAKLSTMRGRGDPAPSVGRPTRDSRMALPKQTTSLLVTARQLVAALPADAVLLLPEGDLDWSD